MTGLHWRGSVGRLALLLVTLIVLVLVLSGLLMLGGRAARPALAAGCGIVGLILVGAGIVLLALTRSGSRRVTGASAFGALALSVPFLGASLVI